MKKHLITTILFLPFVAFAQTMPVNAIKWVDKDLGYLRFFKNELIYNFDGTESTAGFKISGGTLIINDVFISSTHSFSRVKFLYKNKDNKILTVKPIDEGAKMLVNKPSYQFKNIAELYDPNFKFKRFVFTLVVVKALVRV